MKLKKATAYALHAVLYMVRHITQLPVTINTIAKAEGLPPAYLAKIFQQFVKAGFIKAARGPNKGYVFVRPPEEISMLELVELFEGRELFGDCLFRHCECGGTPQNCLIYSMWHNSTSKLVKLLADTSLADAAWSHPEHRFDSIPESHRPSKRYNTRKTERT